MTKTVPIFAILAIGADACCRLPGLNLWHLKAGSLLAATSGSSEIQNLLTPWGSKP